MKNGGSVGPAFRLLILMAGMGDALSMALLFPVLPAISAHFADVPYAPTLVRGLVTAVSLAMVVGAPMAGFMVERFGTRKVLLCAAFVFTVSGVAGFFINTLWLMLASRFVLGLSDVAVSTTVIGLIADRLEPAQRNRWIGVFSSVGAAGSLVCMQLAGLVAGYSWRLVFLFYAAGLVIIASAVMALKPGVEQRKSAWKSTMPGLQSLTAPLLILPLVGLSIAAGAVESTTPIFLPFHLVEIGESVPSRIAQAVLPITAGVTISAFCYGQLRRRLSIANIFVLAFLSAGLALIWLGMAQSFAMTLAAASFLGLGIGLLAPNIYAYAAVYRSAVHRVRDIGIARGAFFVGAPFAQLLLEPVAKFAGYGIAIVTLGCASMLLMVWPLTQGRRIDGTT